jgi:glycerol-3-phosphate acyltransferase PlsY
MAVIVVLAGYLLGSVSFSVLIARWRGGIDIRAHGSGNAGATNTLRVLGLGPAVAVFVLDTLKGVIAVLLALWLVPDAPWAHVAAGLAAVAGHNWPIWFRFRGGKGIATTIGIVATLMFFPGLAAGIVGILAIVFTRYVSLGSLLFTGLLPLSALLFKQPAELVWGSLIIAAFAWYRHRKNLVKLLKGEENKLGDKRAKLAVRGAAAESGQASAGTIGADPAKPQGGTNVAETTAGAEPSTPAQPVKGDNRH